MKVISVKKQRKGLSSVLLLDGRELLLDTEIVLIKDLRPGVILDDPDALLYESDLKRAKNRALWYLSRGDLSEKKLYEKLTAGGFSQNAVDAAVCRMCELDLINDERLANRLYEGLSQSGASKREIIFKLQNKGIPYDIAKQLAEEDEADERDKIKKLIKTKYALKLDTEEGVKKVFSTLVRHGYSYSDVREALRAYSEEIEEIEEF